MKNEASYRFPTTGPEIFWHRKDKNDCICRQRVISSFSRSQSNSITSGSHTSVCYCNKNSLSQTTVSIAKWGTFFSMSLLLPDLSYHDRQVQSLEVNSSINASRFLADRLENTLQMTSVHTHVYWKIVTKSTFFTRPKRHGKHTLLMSTKTTSTGSAFPAAAMYIFQQKLRSSRTRERNINTLFWRAR